MVIRKEQQVASALGEVAQLPGESCRVVGYGITAFDGSDQSAAGKVVFYITKNLTVRESAGYARGAN